MFSRCSYGIPSHLHAIDGVLGGWEPGAVTIVASRPSGGAEELLVNYSVHSSRTGRIALIAVSPRGPIWTRYGQLSNRTGIPCDASYDNEDAPTLQLHTYRQGRWIDTGWARFDADTFRVLDPADDENERFPSCRPPDTPFHAPYLHLSHIDHPHRA